MKKTTYQGIRQRNPSPVMQVLAKQNVVKLTMRPRDAYEEEILEL